MTLTSKTVLVTAMFFSVGSDASTSLRSTSENKNDLTETDNGTARKLQLANNILNSLIDVFTPSLGEFVAEELEEFDPIVFGNETTVALGDTDFDGACPSSANISYGVGAVTGLGDIDVNQIELIPGSEDIKVSFLALDGATWSGQWIFNVSFPNITAETTVGLKANLCGFPIEQTVRGVTTISNPSVEFTLKMDGKTSNVLQFQRSSQVISAVVEEVDLVLGSVDANFGVQGNVVQLDFADSLETWLLNDFSNDIEPLIINVANAFLESEAPFALSDEGTIVSRNGSN